MNKLVKPEDIGTYRSTLYLKDELEESDLINLFGFRMLIRMREVPDAIGKILLAPSSISHFKNVASFGRLIAMGDECFSRNKSSYAELGDWIAISPTEGQRLTIKRREVRVINDDQMLFARETEPNFSESGR